MTDDICEDIKLQFEQFLTLVGNVLAHEKEINIIQNKLRRHFNSTTPTYLCSADFRSRFNDIRRLFNQNDKSTKYFKLLASFDEQLKKNSIKTSGSHRSSNEVPLPTHNTEPVNTTPVTNENIVITSTQSFTTTILRSPSPTINEQNISASTVEQTVDRLLNSCTNFLLELNKSRLQINNETRITTDSNNTSENEMKREKKIRKLERRLSNLSKTIRELEQKDMSLAEMEYCDLYCVESRLKKQACEVYAKLAGLKKQPSSAERILDQPVTLTETEIDYPLINKALEDMVNQTKFLPCFNDVLDTVEKTNDEHKLDLSPEIQKNLAKKCFQLIGKKVKNRRMADFNDIMKSRLPEDFDIEQNDPALSHIELENTLIENEREAVVKTEKIFEEFSQIDPDLEPEINIESSEEFANETEEEEENEDDEEEEVMVKSDLIVEPCDIKSDENNYDIVDILPPFSSRSSSPSPSIVNETENNEHPVEATVEISLNDRTLTILSTASIPVKRAKYEPFTTIMQRNESEVYTVLDDSDTQESQPISIIQEHKVQTIIPRRRQHTSVTGTLYNYFKQPLVDNGSSNASKRPLSADVATSVQKELKEPPEVVILD